MAYRPQFAFPPAPPGFHDEPYEYFFDATNTPGLSLTLTSGQQQNSIPLPLDPDSEFHARGIEIGNLATLPQPLGVRLRDTDGNYLSQEFVPVQFLSGFLGPSANEGGEASPVESELVCAPGGTLQLDVANIDPPPPYNPTLIDTASTDLLGAYLMGPNGYGQAQQQAPFAFNGALYIVLYRSPTAPTTDTSINVYRSIDSGRTWSILDGSHAPVRGDGQATGGCYFDGLHTITVAYTDGSPSANGTIHLQDFNLLTSTWGAAYGATNSPTVRIVDQIYKRSDGTLIALFNTTFAAGRIQGLSAAVFSAGAWANSFTVEATNISAGNVSLGRAATVLDPATGTLHVFTVCSDTATFTTSFWFYQQILLNNTLGNFHQFATNAFNSVTNGTGNPLIVGSKIVWGVMNNAGTHATLVVGTPVANPTFTVMADPGIDPTSPFSLIGYIPLLAYDGVGTLYALIAIYDNSGPAFYMQLRLLTTTNVANPASGPWAAQVIYDTRQASSPASFYFPNQIWNNGNLALLGGQVLVTYEAVLDNTAIQDTTFFFGLFTPTISLPVTLRGVKRFADQVCKV